MIALCPSLCAETVRNVTIIELTECNVTDVVKNVSSDCCLNCSYSHINVSEKDKMTIMEDILLVLYAWEVGIKKWVGGHVEKQPVSSSTRHREGLAMATTVVH
jgi:hypothetical protein